MKDEDKNLNVLQHVENGVGNGYKKGNNGDLIFLDEGKKDGTDINKRELYGYNRKCRAGSKDNVYTTIGLARETDHGSHLNGGIPIR